MPASNFPARVAHGYEHSFNEEYVPSQVAAETLIPGDFAVWDDTNNWIERGGADPTPIWGLCEVDSEAARVLTPNGKIPLRKLSSNVILAMASATAYVEATHRGADFGVVRNAQGRWLVDTAETTNIRVNVVNGETVTNTWFCRPLAAHFDDGVVS